MALWLASACWSARAAAARAVATWANEPCELAADETLEEVEGPLEQDADEMEAVEEADEADEAGDVAVAPPAVSATKRWISLW